MSISNTRQAVRACEDQIAETAKAAQEVMQKATDEGRSRTDDENAEIASFHKKLETLRANKREFEDQLEIEKGIEGDLKNLDPNPEFGHFGRDVQTPGKSVEEIASLGDQFIEAKGYKDLLESGMSGQRWSTGAVELKATLAETPGTALTPPSYSPGVVQTLFQRNYVSDAFAQVQTNASQVLYVSETTATNAAAAVSEAQAKPQSTFVFGETAEAVRKIATILPITDEMLADAPQIQAYINSRLVLFIKNTEEAQVLTGSGTAPNIAGVISGGRTIGTFTRSAGTSNERALFMAMNGTRGSSQLDPDLIVIHPTNWQTIRLGTDTTGNYLGGGPFQIGPYGGPMGPASSSQFAADTIWGVPVVVTSNIPLGTALVGNFKQGGAVYRRQGVTVEATNSHSTWFADNITALRAEERLALAIYRPSAFTAVISLS